MKKKIDYHVLLGIFICAVFPLIIRAVGVPFSEETYFWTGQRGTYDIVNYAKGMVLIFVAAVLGITILFESLTGGKRLKRDRIIGAIGAMAALALISWGMSKHPQEAFNGAFDHFEGILVWLAYLIVFMMAYTGDLKQAQMQKILPVAAGSAVLVAITGILQFFGVQLFDSKMFRMLILPASQWATTQSVFDGFGNMASSFLGNPNYVGTYTILVIPLLLFGYSIDTRLNRRLLYGLAIALNTAFLVCSRSEAGFMGFMISTGLLLALGIVHRQRVVALATVLLQVLYWGCFVGTGVWATGEVPASILVAVFSSSGIIALILFSPAIQKSMKIATCVVVLVVGGVGIGKVTAHESDTWKSHVEWKAITASDQQIVFDTLKNGKAVPVLTVTKVPEGFSILSGTLAVVVKNEALSEEKVQLNATETLGSALQIYSAPGGVVAFEMDSPKLRFGYAQNRFEVYNRAGFPVDAKAKIAVFDLFKDETIGTNRGYIWNRTLPLIPRHPIVGTGPDTFILEFPQNDLMGKINTYGNANMVITKPHNIYLQLAVNLGVPFLLLYLLLNAMVLKRSFTMLDPKSGMWILGVAVVGYLVTGIFNDSVVVTAAICWYLMGVILGWSEGKKAG